MCQVLSHIDMVVAIEVNFVFVVKENFVLVKSILNHLFLSKVLVVHPCVLPCLKEFRTLVVDVVVQRRTVC